MIILNETDFDKVLDIIEGNAKNVPTFSYSVLNDCDILNKSSIKLAEKLGFGNPVKYSIFV